MIELTQDLLKNQQDESSKQQNETVPVEEPPPVVDPEQDATARALKRRKWKAGDRCMAKWEEDGQSVFPIFHEILDFKVICLLYGLFMYFRFYEATIQDIIDCTARVLFSDYHQYATSHVDDLKELPTGIKRSADDDDETNKYIPKKFKQNTF